MVLVVTLIFSSNLSMLSLRAVALVTNTSLLETHFCLKINGRNRIYQRFHHLLPTSTFFRSSMCSTTYPYFSCICELFHCISCTKIGKLWCFDDTECCWYISILQCMSSAAEALLINVKLFASKPKYFIGLTHFSSFYNICRFHTASGTNITRGILQMLWHENCVNAILVKKTKHYKLRTSIILNIEEQKLVVMAESFINAFPGLSPLVYTIRHFELTF